MSLDLRSRRDLYERLATAVDDEEPFDEPGRVDDPDDDSGPDQG